MLDYTVTFLVFCLFICEKKGRLGCKVVWRGGGGEESRRKMLK